MTVRGDWPVFGEGNDRMKLAKVSRDELALIIQRRALEIAAGDGNNSNIPIPAVDVFPEPIGTSEVHQYDVDTDD